MQHHGAKGGKLVQLHAVKALVGAYVHAHTALAALPRGKHHAGLAVGHLLKLQGIGAAGFFAPAAAKAVVGELGHIVAVLQGRFHGGFQLLCALVQQQAEVHPAVLFTAQTGQHLQQLFGAALGAVAHLFQHLAAGQLLHMVGVLLFLIRQREPRFEHRLTEKVHKAGQFAAQLLGAQVVLALPAGGQIQHDLFVQRQIRQRLPREGTDAAAHHGVLAGGLFTADPDGIAVGVRRGGIPLHLLGRRRNAAAAAGRNAQSAVGAGIPVLDEVRAGKDLFAIGADVLAGRAGLAVRVQIPALAAVDLGMAGLHQGIHCSSGKKAHGLTPFPQQR